MAGFNSSARNDIDPLALAFAGDGDVLDEDDDNGAGSPTDCMIISDCNDERELDSLRTAFEQLQNRVQQLETQIATYAQNQPLLFQVIDKQKVFEQKQQIVLKEFKEELLGALADLTNKLETRSSRSQDQNQNGFGVNDHDHDHSDGGQIDCNSAWDQGQESGLEELEEFHEEDDANSNSNQDYHPLASNSVKVEILESVDPTDETEVHASESGFGSSSKSEHGHEHMVQASSSGSSSSGSRNSWYNFYCKLCPRSAATRFQAAEELADHYTNFHPILQLDQAGPSSRARANANTRASTSSSSRRKASVSSNMTRMGVGLETNQGTQRNGIQYQANLTHAEFDDSRPQPQLLQVSITPVSLPPDCIIYEDNHEKPFQCPDCGRGFEYQHSLTLHKRSAHPSVRNAARRKRAAKRAICTVCGRSVLVGALKVHMQIHSTQREKVYCQICGAGFTSKEGFSAHIRKHNGERPFACPHCDKRFTSNPILRNHVMLHEGKPHECDECDKAFARPSLLKKHKELEHPTMVVGSGPIWVTEGLADAQDELLNS